MVFVSVTRLHLRSPFDFPAFGWNLLLTTWQIINTPGFLGGKLLQDAHRTFWTMTAWDEQTAMKIYRNSGAHRSVMPKIEDWCDEASVVHWRQEDSNLPDWLEAHHRLVSKGFLTKLPKPSLAHLNRDIPEPVVPRDLPLRPRKRNART